MKKIINLIIVIITLFNFIFCNVAFAGNGLGTDAIVPDTFEDSSLKKYLESGETGDKDKNGNEIVNTISSSSVGGSISLDTIAGILAIVLDAFPMLLQSLMTMVAYQGSQTSKIITIEDMVFNQIEVFKIDYFKFNSSSEMANTFRKSVAKYYYIFRLIAVALSLLTLIYVGIRMALSVTSDEKAKYKKMLIGWVESIVILFLLQYIIAVLLNLGEAFSEIVYQMKGTSSQISFEDQIITTIYTFLSRTSGWTYCLYSVIFFLLVFIQTKFFLAYVKRLITVGFLILIAPLVTVTYPIDKVGDGKAQAFNNWLTELSVNIFIQPIQALIYLVFMFLAGEIAKTSLLVAVLFLLALTKVEKIVLQLFNVKGKSLHLAADERKKG